ncbi:HDOD domain-containing protein [Clostridiisalibacter paucivorans]|uniref:HDOD domain-containing protein n=1 Tax=Clostridiisalibacter paucivorans TaxID=408753 RepID=UPI000479C3BB|nr:HDOD domain-containing protein [Clostridiisalibacter paucivorans]
MNNKLSLDKLIQLVDDMPVFPNRINKILKLTEDPNSTVHDIETEILKDQSLTAKVLKLANSTHYGYSRRISTITEATVLLGFKTIRSITLASSVSKVLMQELPGYGLEKDMLWEQSQTCAIIARQLAKKTRKSDPEQAYIAGLLRDIGKVILSYYVKKEYNLIVEKVGSSGRSFQDAEKEVLGFDHAQIGAKIAEKWNFPQDLIDAIENHHTPAQSNVNKDLVSLIHVADALVMTMGISMGYDGMAYYMSPFALETLELDEIKIQEIIANTSDLLTDEDNLKL